MFQLLLDVVLCNGFGIFIGMRVCNLLEMREYNWESIKYINSASGKMKRALFQFTPMSWHRVQWFDSPPKKTKASRVKSCSRSESEATSNGHVEWASVNANGYGSTLSRMASDPQYVWNRVRLVFIVLLLCQVMHLRTTSPLLIAL